MSNEAVSVILKERDLTAIAGQGQLREGELAALLASFEEQKKELDYMHYEDVMYLRGRSPNRTFPLPAEDAVKACRDAFTAPLAFLTTELRQVAQLGTDFSVLLCGGSCCGQGLYTEINSLLDSVGAVAAASGIRMNRLFLGNERYSYDEVPAMSYAC